MTSSIPLSGQPAAAGDTAEAGPGAPRGGPSTNGDRDRTAAAPGGADTDAVLGRVRWFSQEKGYGFIEPDDDGADVFVRHSVIDGEGFRCLEADQRVRFARTVDARGPRATAVEVVD